MGLGYGFRVLGLGFRASKIRAHISGSPLYGDWLKKSVEHGTICGFPILKRVSISLKLQGPK